MSTALPSLFVRATRLVRKEPLDMSTALPSHCGVRYIGLLFLFFGHQGDKHSTTYSTLPTIQAPRDSAWEE